MSTDPKQPLEGLRVLDASRVLAGPLCTQILGDLGAAVVKVERPGSGDETRAWGPPFLDDRSAYYLCCNRNKKAVALDLARPEGLNLFYRLAGQCDVLVENFRAASLQRLGLGVDQLWQANPRLVICSISGFGRSGPWSDLPGYDFAIQALSGLMSITGPVQGPPTKVGVALTDVLTGLYAAVAILACLRARSTTGRGYAIDMALLDCAVAAQVNVAQAFLTSGQLPARQGNAHLQIVPYQLFQTADDWLVLAVGNDGQWRSFCRAAGEPELESDTRFSTNELRVENRSVLVPRLEEVMRNKTSAGWLQLLETAGVPCAPVWDYARLFSHPQAEARGLRCRIRDADGQEVDLLGSPFKIAGFEAPPPLSPPRLGEHTAEILTAWLGLDAAQIDRLRSGGIAG